MNINSEIQSIVSEIIGIQSNEIDPDARFIEDLGFDSLRALEILAAIENKFDITIDPQNLAKMTTLNEVVHITKQVMNGNN